LDLENLLKLGLRSKWRKLMNKTNRIATALERISEAAHSLALHGAGGYSVDTSALDAVFVRSLLELRNALMNEDDLNVSEYFDPRGDLNIAMEGVE
jgi:hypothetical protein